MVFRLLTIYEVELKTKRNISEVNIQRRAMNSYPFGLDYAINEGTRKTRPVLYQKKLYNIFENLQDLLRLSMRDGFPVLLTVMVIRFHGLKDEDMTYNTE